MSSEVSPRWRFVGRAATGVWLAVGLVALIVLGVGGDRLLGGMNAAQEQDQSVRSAQLTTSIRDLARMQTTAYHIEKVIDLRQRHEHFWGLISGEDAILLIAAGDVTAGVDLSLIESSDVQVDDKRKSVRVILPPARVFSAELDNERTFVHSRTTDLLAERNENLEVRARKAAEQAMQQAAMEAGILARASRNAEQTLRALLTSLGFEHVEVQWQSDS